MQQLDGTATCHDQQVFNNTELWLLFRKPGTKDDWDDLTEVAGQVFEYDYPRPKKEEGKKAEEAD